MNSYQTQIGINGLQLYVALPLILNNSYIVHVYVKKCNKMFRVARAGHNEFRLCISKGV